MKLKFKQLNEKLYKISSDIYAFDYVGTMVNLLKRQNEEYRILYDGMLDMYFMCPSRNHIHNDMLRQTFKDGWYEEYKDKIEEFSCYSRYDYAGYSDYGQTGYETDEGKYVDSWLVYIIFSPNRKWKLGEDGYDYVYHTTFGDILTRNSYLNDDFLNYIKNDIESENSL